VYILVDSTVSTSQWGKKRTVELFVELNNEMVSFKQAVGMQENIDGKGARTD
jgi:hypothetical protein